MANSELKIKYYLGILIMLLFVVGDLTFDFLLTFEGSNAISFACTLFAAIVVFYGSYSIKKANITNEFENATSFIKSNFDNWQVIFSILDIVCGLISLLSGLAFLTAIFKVVKIGYVPLKIAVVTNKGKSVVKAIAKVSLLWTSGRLLSECGDDTNKENKSMFKKIGNALKTARQWIWANKKSLLGTISAVISGVVTAMAVHSDLLAFVPAVYLFGFDVMPYIAGLIIFGLAELGVTGRGFELIKTFLLKQAEIKALKEAEKAVKVEQKAKAALDKEAEKYLKEQEAKEKEAAKLAALEEAKKAQELKRQQEEAEKAEIERKLAAEKAAEEQRIIARAMELKAEAQRKAAEEANKQ